MLETAHGQGDMFFNRSLLVVGLFYRILGMLGVVSPYLFLAS